MKNFGIIFFMLLVSVAYSIFVWFFTDNEVVITGKPVKCAPIIDTVRVVDTLKDINPIVQHSRIRKN